MRYDISDGMNNERLIAYTEIVKAQNYEYIEIVNGRCYTNSAIIAGIHSDDGFNVMAEEQAVIYVLNSDPQIENIECFIDYYREESDQSDAEIFYSGDHKSLVTNSFELALCVNEGSNTKSVFVSNI